MALREIAPVLQLALGPVILISGVGLLLLSMTNRLGRLIDRARLLSEARRKATADDRERVEAQIEVLSTRAIYMRRAIVLAVVSLLCAAALVITLFLAAVLGWDAAIVAVVLFALCMILLIASLIAFLQDVNRSLTAIRLELGAPPTG
jgi:VIT1/CCC1 family predicted Fe2+/Mn2+ transporter